MKKKIIVCDHIHQIGLGMLHGQSDLIVEDLSSLSKSDLLPRLGSAHALITRSPTPINEELLDHACKEGNLQAIVRAGVGVDNVDMDACSMRGVVVMNVPTANTIAAVELTMAHILNAVRRFPGANDQLKNLRIWKREDWYGTELRGKKLGIIGFGNIGSRVGIRAKAFEMEVIAYDPYISPSKATDVGAEHTRNFDDILACDIITIHTPKNSQTNNMISDAQIRKMKDGVILINCARGGLYNEDALYNALKDGKVAFASMDVFEKEPATDNKLLELDNIYVTPHIGANTMESQERIAIDAANTAISAVRASSYPNALNLPLGAVSSDLSGVYPYMELSQKLGFFLSQAIEGAITSISICISGPDLEAHRDSLLVFAVVGALKHHLGDGINFVNALFKAKDRNVNTSVETKSGLTPYRNRLTVTLSTQDEVMSASGVVYDDHIIRFTDINHFDMDVEPKGNMILVRNTDVPGVIGSIGNTIAKHNVNIADFRLGRSDRRGALALILVDSAVSSELLSDLCSIRECTSIRFVGM